MRPFATIADATRAAAESGASIEVGGRTINAGGARMSVVPRQTKFEDPAPVAPPQRPDPMERMAELMALQAQVVAALSGMRQEQPAVNVTVPAPEVTVTMPEAAGWRFDVDYHPNGAIKGLTAKRMSE